ncbi:MAG: hypothetical protein ACM31C_02300 [Acidobacteriota bacterium]
MKSRTAIVIFLVELCACRARDTHEIPASTRSAPKPVLAHATQQDLARELDDAEHRGTWPEVRARWQGQRLHWTVTRQRSLCRTVDACHVAAFPITRPAKVGWMPALQLAAGEWSKLEAACGDAERCRLEIDGTLAELVVSPELPTSLKFSDVRIVDATPERGKLARR